MRHLVAAGTDVASLLLFDPGALPEHFDAQARGDCHELLEQLTEAGRACWIQTGADGAYLLHAYVDAPVPAPLTRYLKEPGTVESFLVPTGRLYFTGAEFAFRDDDRCLRKHPQMGSVFLLRPGVYRLTLWHCETPEGLPEQRLREQLPRLAYLLHQWVMGWLVVLAALGLVALLITARWTAWKVWLSCLLPSWVLLAMLPVVVSRLRPYREACERYQAIQEEFPAFVVQLEFQATTAPFVSDA